MEDLGERGESPVAAMTARVAALWRSQGEAFLAHYDADMVDDVDRLRRALVVTIEPEKQADGVMDRLRRLDAAAMQRVAAGRPRAVVDLRGPEPVVEVPDGDDGVPPWYQECRRCRRYFSDELLVQAGPKVRPLCLDCAMVVAGVRKR